MAAANTLQRAEKVITAHPEPIREREKQVLDREILVAHFPAGVVRPFEGLRQLTAQRRLGNAVGLRDRGERLGDPLADRQGSYAETVEERNRNAAVLGQRGNQKVVRCDLSVVRVLRECDRLPYRFLGLERPTVRVKRHFLW